jgi:hypothetical protein
MVTLSHEFNCCVIILLWQVDLVNIGGTDIVDGNPKLTLGLLWSIILHWQVGTFPVTLR